MAVIHCVIHYGILCPIEYVFLVELMKKERNNMKEIFQEYGGILITVVAILAVIVVITAVIGTDGNSAIARAFTGLIDNFVTQANANASIGH